MKYFAQTVWYSFRAVSIHCPSGIFEDLRMPVYFLQFLIIFQREEHPQDPLVDLLSTFNISSNISKASETHNTATAQASSAIHLTQTPPVNISQSDEVSKKPTKKQILLAPSFFGPKKK